MWLARAIRAQQPLCSRCLSTGPTSSWLTEWKDVVATVPGASSSYQVASDWLRGVIRTGLLPFTALRDDPAKFFAAHRVVASHAPQLGPGPFIRFTVAYNLWAGTVLGLGNDDQVAWLADAQRRGLLGAFALTEKLAGVNSGLVVNATIEWDAAKGVFRLNTPTTGSEKNWISQGLVADSAVVVANLVVAGKPRGPHAFVMDFRRDGKLVDGVSTTDMGTKTVGNDLDNAAIRFQDVHLPASAMLSRFSEVQGDEYHLKVEGVHPMHMLGQRLFTGRVAVAQAALEFTRGLYAGTRAYSDHKLCWSPDGEVPLSTMPQLASLYDANAASMALLAAFAGEVESQLSRHLLDNTLPSAALIEAIAVAKIRCVRDSIDMCHRLQQEVGSYALMAGTGFEQRDFLQACQFAEGDARILMTKLARDTLRRFDKAGGKLAGGASDDESAVCGQLAAALAAGKSWNDEHATVFALAEAVMDRVIADNV